MSYKMETFDVNNIQLKIQAPELHMKKEFNDYLIAQIEKLGKIYSRISKCEIMLRVQNDDKQNNCEVEAKLHVPGNVFFASEKKSNFNLAAKVVFEDLYNQLYKFKDKLYTKSN